MNTLSFDLIETEYDYGKYTGIQYAVDGKPLIFDRFDLINCRDFFDGIDEGGVIIARCTCGDWFCDSIVADVLENDNNVIQWTMHNIHNDEVINTFQFDKSEYEKVMKELERAARELERKDKSDET